MAAPGQTPPQFWQNHNLEPKRGFRFLLEVATPDGSFKEFLIKSVKKPSFTINATPHNYLNHTFHYPGRVTWNEINFVIVDTVSDGANATVEVLKMLEASGYELPVLPGSAGEESGRGSISKDAAVRTMGSVYIKTLDAEGSEIERWILNNAWVKSADFGGLDYSSEDLLNVTVTMQYDNAYVSLGAKGGGPAFHPNTPGVSI